jgi:REase_AHJR-like
MIDRPGDTRRKRLREIAAEYERRGYRVHIEPSPSQLPAFLRSYRPDLVAEGPDESVVVEVKVPGRSAPGDVWAALAAAVRDQPGWRLELMVERSSFGEDLEPLNRQEILARLREGQALLEHGSADAALLITWAGAEAALRLLFEAEDVEAPDWRPGTLIARLYSDGVLDREAYDVLVRGMNLRNAIAHGFRASGNLPEAVTSLYRSTKRLLGWWAEARRAAVRKPVATGAASRSGDP